MDKQKIVDKIQDRINEMPEGTIFSASDFLDLAESVTIRSVLSRLEKKSGIQSYFWFVCGSEI